MDAVKDSLVQGYNSAKRALSTAPPNDAYLHWDAPGVEEIKPDEEAKAHQIADTMDKMQKHNFDKVRLPSYSTVISSCNPTPTVASTFTPSAQLTSRPKA